MAEVTANDGLAVYILVVVAHAMPTNCPVSFIMLNNDFESKLLPAWYRRAIENALLVGDSEIPLYSLLHIATLR